VKRKPRGKLVWEKKRHQPATTAAAGEFGKADGRRFYAGGSSSTKRVGGDGKGRNALWARGIKRDADVRIWRIVPILLILLMLTAVVMQYKLPPPLLPIPWKYI
jgi:hypothetical protein